MQLEEARIIMRLKLLNIPFESNRNIMRTPMIGIIYNISWKGASFMIRNILKVFQATKVYTSNNEIKIRN